MTRTEERLTDALRVAARHGQDLALRPLTVPDRVRTRWARWLAPVAAAAAVALIVAGALMLTSGRRAPADNDNVPAGPPPRYYVVVEQSSRLVVRATATGAITDSITDPRMRGGAVYGAGAADGGRQFVAAFYDPRRGRPGTALYSFRLTSTGRVSGLHLVRGGLVNGTINGFTGNRLALSADDAEVALPVFNPRNTSLPSFGTTDAAEGIVVVNLRTGEHSVWAGGLRRPGAFLSAIPSISWTPDGHALVFLAQWCPVSDPSCIVGPGYSQVRTLSVAAGGGSLAQGHVLLDSSSRYPYISQAQLDPGGGALTMVVLKDLTWTLRSFHASLQVIRVPLAADGQPRVLYWHGPRGVRWDNTLASDASGQHWLLMSVFNGWLGQGKLHLLPPQTGTAMDGAW